jgi:hypothetical protein
MAKLSPWTQVALKQDNRSPEELSALRQQEYKEAKNELSWTLELVRIRDVATTGYLQQEISIIERLDGMIDRCLKRLLFVRGLKSLSTPSSAVSSVSRIGKAS